jgi:uncharacterized membrane protein
MMNSHLVLLLLILLLLPLAEVLGDQEAKIESMKVKLMIFTGDYALLSYEGELTAGSTAVKSLVFPLVEWNRWMASVEVRRIKAVNHSDNLEIAIVNTTYYAANVLVTFKEPIKPRSSEKFSFVVNISRSIFVIPRGEGGDFSLLFYIICPNATLAKEKLEVSALLPKGSLIKPSDVPSPFTASEIPEGVLVEWLAPALIWPTATGFQFVYVTNYRVQPTPSNTPPPPPPPKQLPILPILASILVILLASTLILVRKRKRRGRVAVPKDIELRINSLDDDELRVLMKVAEIRNGVKQKDLSDLVGFSKAKISRILKKLDNMGLVVREDMRKTKIIKVEESIREILINRAKKNDKVS